MAKPAQGRWTSRYYAKKASTAYTKGGFVYDDGTNVIPAVATTEDILGIVDETALTTDATTKRIKILVPSSPSCTCTVLVGNGTPSTAYEGRLCDLDDTAPTTSVDVDTTTESCCRIEKYINSTTVEVSLVPQKR